MQQRKLRRRILAQRLRKQTVLPLPQCGIGPASRLRLHGSIHGRLHGSAAGAERHG